VTASDTELAGCLTPLPGTVARKDRAGEAAAQIPRGKEVNTVEIEAAVEWTTPDFEEVELAAEVTAYADHW
jgi:coenzyme PQQ precursor peptide PqqA